MLHRRAHRVAYTSGKLNEVCFTLRNVWLLLTTALGLAVADRPRHPRNNSRTFQSQPTGPSEPKFERNG
jgi:hypothetical protein